MQAPAGRDDGLAPGAGPDQQQHHRGQAAENTTCGSEAPCSLASFTNDPMMANMADANNIQRACMGLTATKKGPGGIRESDTILPIAAGPAGAGNPRPARQSKRGTTFARKGP
ncbi:hypothetical protein OkiPb01551_15020 [Bordetella pertussis]|nr:hypothetical protein BPJ_27090 [Bordetella pertussis]BDT08709.1 hypothetical protein BP3J_24130 [Bordetella pertussis]